jgi:hypothetical protein
VIVPPSLTRAAILNLPTDRLGPGSASPATGGYGTLGAGDTVAGTISSRTGISSSTASCRSTPLAGSLAPAAGLDAPHPEIVAVTGFRSVDRKGDAIEIADAGPNRMAPMRQGIDGDRVSCQ